MDDNTVIMTVINEAWSAPGSLLDAFLESFRIGEYIERLLKHLIFDVDIVWFRNPLRHISVAAHITNPDDLANIANGGFLYAKYPGEHDQSVFNQIKYEFSSRFRVTIRFLDAVYCDGLCHPRKHFDKICTFHVTCRAGLAKMTSSLGKPSRIQEW
ncbi:Uncharacterized protein ACMD2_05513 [Ananas comosus]|uniref:Nucleotide-diphospho-sugar transferase domain-containing protein n=1 Tax=Ananas comosus TaxID=4615 RepID=A0A199W9Z3_ANACO|nr:Uncharacterized protein ACMD2_05513 [Ananas comosus]